MAFLNGTSIPEVPLVNLTKGDRYAYPGAAIGRIGDFGSIGFSLRNNYRMRGWSPLLSRYVEWQATLIDALGVQAPVSAGPLNYIVWLDTV